MKRYWKVGREWLLTSVRALLTEGGDPILTESGSELETET